MHGRQEEEAGGHTQEGDLGRTYGHNQYGAVGKQGQPSHIERHLHGEFDPADPADTGTVGPLGTLSTSQMDDDADLVSGMAYEMELLEAEVISGH